MRMYFLSAALAALALGCGESEVTTASHARSAAAASSQSNVPFSLSAPAGAPYPDAVAGAKIDGQFLDGTHPNFHPAQGVRMQVHGLPCRCYSGGTEAREFYVVYLSTPSTSPIRLLTFNTSFLGNVGAELVMPVPLSVPLFAETVTIEVFLESDDGADGPAGSGVLVLRGQVTPS